MSVVRTWWLEIACGFVIITILVMLYLVAFGLVPGCPRTWIINMPS